MEYKHLVCVTGVNNNKYYDMRQLNDDTFEAVYGRIGVTANKAIYPISRWKSISSTSGMIATVQVEVWILPPDSVSGTRCTR